MVDHGNQSTAVSSISTCSSLNSQPTFMSYYELNTPQGNADTERMMRTLKEVLVGIRKWTSQPEFFDELKHWV